MIARRIVAGALLGGAVAVIVILLFTGGSSYSLRLNFQDASQLVSGNQVKVGGVPIGTVSDIEVTPNGQAQVTIGISDSQFDPLHRGTTAQVRISSLSSVANRFIAISPGPNNASPLANDDVIPSTHTQSQVDIDALQSAFDASTRLAEQELIHGGAAAYAGSGPALNKGLAALDPALTQLSSMITEISGDNAAFDQFIVNGATVVAAVSSHQQDLQQGLSNAATTAQAIATERTALDGALAKAPATLTHATATLNHTDTALAALQPDARQLLPVAPRLAGFFTRLAPVLHRSIPVLAQVKSLLPTLRTALVDLPALRNAALPAFNASVSAIGSSAHILEGTLPYVPDIVLGNTNGFAGTAGGNYDANGDYARIAVVGGPFSVAGVLGSLLPYSPIEGYTQHNVERCPGAATQIAADNSNLVPQPSTIPCLQSERP
ncbi:MAG TPA: MlaD family protein [Solirubrobacteraceae bacterium]|nr:MlaD family protein [Solirubrobacteraceae bacterium]